VLPRAAGVSVAELALAFLERNLAGYSASEGKYYRSAAGAMASLAGGVPAAEFGPRALSEIRDAMVAKGWTREHVNAQVRRVRAVFRWGESVELVPAGKWFQLRSLPGLKAGKTSAPEQKKKQTVPDAVVEATLPSLSPTVAAMVRFQRLTGCRPQDVCNLNAAELDRTGTVWVFRPALHKTAHRGHHHPVYIGPRAQALLRPLLEGREDATAVFSPRLAWGERRAVGAKGKRWRGYEKKGPPVGVKDAYDVGAYIKAIKRAVDRANAERVEDDQLPYWTPNSLRHTTLTEVRERHGLEAAQKIGGHKHASTTEHYAKPTDEAAVRIAAMEG
jgi:integrase